MSFSQQSLNSALFEQYPSVPGIRAQLELHLTELGIVFEKLFSVWAFCQGNDPGIPQVTTWSAVCHRWFFQGQQEESCAVTVPDENLLSLMCEYSFC